MALADNTLEYKPYRGECEPVTEITVAKLIMHKDHLEVKCFYKFQELIDPVSMEPFARGHFIGDVRYRDNFVKVHLLIRKGDIEVCRSVRIHELDKKQEECPIIEISTNKNRFNVLCKNDEADMIMKALKTYILG